MDKYHDMILKDMRDTMDKHGLTEKSVPYLHMLAEMAQALEGVKYHPRREGGAPDAIDGAFWEKLGGYWSDYMQHKAAYEESKDAAEKQHMLLELQEWCEYTARALKHLRDMATTPEETRLLGPM